MNKIDCENKEKRERLTILLQTSKQELMQADAKLGYLFAGYALVIASLIALAIAINRWDIIGPCMIPSLLSAVIIIYALQPRRIIARKDMKDSSPFNPFNFVFDGETSNDDFNGAMLNTIKIWTHLAKLKYRFAKASYYIFSLGLIWLFTKILGACWKNE